MKSVSMWMNIETAKLAILPVKLITEGVGVSISSTYPSWSKSFRLSACMLSAAILPACKNCLHHRHGFPGRSTSRTPTAAVTAPLLEFTNLYLDSRSLNIITVCFLATFSPIQSSNVILKRCLSPINEVKMPQKTGTRLSIFKP